MVFSSLFFIYAFLPLSLLCYSLCRTLRAKNICLLIFSLIFYAWGEPKYVLILMLMSFVDWFCALRIETGRQEARRLWLILAAVTDIAFIGYFKYSGFICSLFGFVPEFIRRIALPIGISFYTFQLLTYVVDVYRGEAKAQRNYTDVLLYASLFHQCIAGPIVRYKGISEELFVARSGRDEMADGICRFAVGLSKKVLLANPCGLLADTVLLTSATLSDPALFTSSLAHLQGLSTLDVWVGMLGFTLQIYLYFSAYSDMAIGMGMMLGLHYPENFDYPYTSRSITEFWRRWHISLGSFFRDYVYIPLGGNRVPKGRLFFNLFVVWALTGLWHGASFNFMLWGIYFFVFLMLEKSFLLKALDRSRVLSRIYTLVIVYFGWVLFRFTDLRMVWLVLRGLFAANGAPLTSFLSVTRLENNIFLLLVSVFACTPAMKKLGEVLDRRLGSARAWLICRKALLPIALLLLSTCALVGDSYNPFIYFQF